MRATCSFKMCTSHYRDNCPTLQTPLQLGTEKRRLWPLLLSPEGVWSLSPHLYPPGRPAQGCWGPAEWRASQEGVGEEGGREWLPFPYLPQGLEFIMTSFMMSSQFDCIHYQKLMALSHIYIHTLFVLTCVNMFVHCGGSMLIVASPKVMHKQISFIWGRKYIALES